ncbi:phage tail protein [Paenibacillus melissococcoides]|uniref:Phage tail protein n=3 Tax=Paenibacillus TaxID=44249 RepID=A0ABN8UBJ9_9BACL|nr:phage tail protein [Paenibacillus melissococcoides]QVQ56204.1 tail protein [Paenibacillus phage Pd_22F]CAH8248547.1 phage tail protein [Paenibacillus melissococcoides]CAH8714422.1 phage tail protein [Paenibacillus melissococcoides]CAH8719790.1 phage tail protein [Paenibacillus melissococcoides]
MGAFGGMIITNKGRALQAKAQTGIELKYTRIKVGDGKLGGQSIPTLNNLISAKKSLDIKKLEVRPDGKAVVGTMLSNAGLQSGFYFREIGVFAQDPDVGEIMFCYANSGDNAEYIPPEGGPDVIEKYIDAVTIIQNAQNVSAVIDGSLVYATNKEMEEKVAKALNEAKAYTDQKVDDIDLSNITPESIGAAKQADLDAHATDAVKHITAAERTSWNAKETTDGAQEKANQAEANAKNASLPRSGGTITGGLVVNGALTVQSRNVLEEIDNVKSSVVDGKGKVAGAINDKGGGPVSANSTFDQLAAAITGMQEARGNLALTSAFFDMLNSYTGISVMFINKDNNIVLIRQTSSGDPPRFQSELHEVSPNGTVVRAVHLGAPQALPPRSFAVGDDVVLVTTEDLAGNGFYEVYDHAGTLISKSQVSYLDVLRTHAITRDGSIFIAQSGNPVRVVNQSGTAYFSMPDGSGNAYEFVFLSKTKLYVARQDSPTSRKHTLITRDGLSFSYEMAARGTGITGIVNFLGAHAYRD